jgi:tetratricopeptide (TPR) repeat protein
VSRTWGCAEIAESGGVERYLAGRLAPAEVEAFELHYLTCARCREEVRLGAAIRAGLVSRVHRRGLARPALGVLALAAGIAALALVARRGAESPLERLGRMEEPPAYSAIRVRGPASALDSVLDAAVAAYRAREYAAAAAAFRAALAQGLERAPGDFFLAASLLLAGDPTGAEAGFGRVIELGSTPYLTEARYYRAKALLRLGRGPEALLELRGAARSTGILGEVARNLADSVEVMLRR